MATKKQKVTNVPNLRFPGFEAEWTKMNLGKASEKINSGKTPLGGESTYTTEGVVFIRSQNVNNDKLELNNTVFISEEVNNSMKNSVVRANDILLNITGASLGRCCVVPTDFETGNVNQHVCIIRLKDGYNPRFIQPKLSSSKGQNIFLSLQTGSGREGLNFESIKSIELDFPRKNEQDKIARFLSLIDQRIETQNKIIDYLESSMLILREKLLTQILRFRDRNGTAFRDWEMRKLGDIGHTYNGLSGKSKEDFGSGKSYIQYKQIFDSSMIEIQKCGLVEVSSYENQNAVMYGDIFFTISSETPHEIGMSSVLLNEVQEMYLNSFCFGYRPISQEILNPFFARYLFRSAVFRNEIVKLAQGSTRYNMSKTQLMKLEIALPSIEEQKNIAKFLSSLDQKIDVEKNILYRYKAQKKYLIEKLFV